jgi:hypothetical protein
MHENPYHMDQEVRRTSTSATTPEPTNRARTAAETSEMRCTPPVSGNTRAEADAEGLALLVALSLEAGLAEAEALLIALVVAEAEALEEGLVTLLSSNPRSSIPLSSKPRSSIPLSSAPISSPWAAATGAKTNTANATDKTSKTDLRTVSPRLCLHIHDKDAPPGAVRPIQIHGYFLIAVLESPTVATHR